jgi:hypothetical protein
MMTASYIRPLGELTMLELNAMDFDPTKTKAEAYDLARRIFKGGDSGSGANGKEVTDVYAYLGEFRGDCLTPRQSAILAGFGDFVNENNLLVEVTVWGP